ncbi:hypothetical protein PVL29_017358 [Vitis rotundifolia]|uniref:60S ribosomal export protein NMD3 n=1 Tax=Vitis rotundifolia TaxID=103349 RepID=A0AA39DHP9_VITRO|nr:hypothetical protein PVL29_017358 [Vitis rotundifolia]
MLPICVSSACSEVDITEGLQKHVTLLHCPECDRYPKPSRAWIKAQLESKQLSASCLKMLKNLNKVRLIHGEFVKLRVQKEVLNGAILEQVYIVEYVNPDQWVASVQIWQHVSHRWNFSYQEQLILRHDAADLAVKFKQMDQGIDFYFANRSHGVKFMEFIGKVTPIRSRHDKQLVSHDPESNNYNYKYTFSVEICPICREDLIYLPPKVAVSLGNLGPLVIWATVALCWILLLRSTVPRKPYFHESDVYMD